MQRIRWVVSVLVLVLALLIAPTTGAQVTVQAPPANDNFINAKPITIGQDFIESNIHEATVEVGQPATTSCGSSSSIGHTVWYSFNLPYGADLHFSTGGSLFRFTTGQETYDTKLAIYTGSTLGTLTQVACVDDSLTTYAELDQSVGANTTYYIMVGSFTSGALQAGSTLRLTTRMIEYYYFPSNYNFESPLTGADWNVTGSSGDATACSNPSYPAYNGSCAFRFEGNAGENSRLKLSKPLSPDFLPRKNGTLTMILAYRVQNAALGNAKIKFKVLYSDGTPASIYVVNLTGAVTMGSYETAFRNSILASKNVSKVQFQVDFKSTVGVLMIDYARIEYHAPTAIRGGVLPLPAALKN